MSQSNNVTIRATISMVVPLVCQLLVARGRAEESPAGVGLIGYFEQIQSLEMSFRMSTIFFHEADAATATMFRDTVFEDGSFVYDAAGRRCLEYTWIEDGQKKRLRASEINGELRTLIEVVGESAVGRVETGNTTVFDLNGPEAFLPLTYYRRMRWKELLEGRYETTRVDDDPGTAQIVIGPEGFQTILTVSSRHGWCPTKWQVFKNGKLKRQTDIEVFEYQPGLWLPEHAERTSYESDADSLVPFMRLELHVDVESIHVNRSIDDSAVSVVFPYGIKVRDVDNKTTYVVGLKPGQGLRKDVRRYAKHARSMLSTSGEPQKKNEIANEAVNLNPGTVTARYDSSSWYRRTWIWFGGFVILLIYAGYYVMRRAS